MAGFNRLRTHDQTSLLLFANILKLVLLIDFYFLTNNIKHVNLAEFLKRCLKTGQNIRTGNLVSGHRGDDVQSFQLPINNFQGHRRF